MQTQNSMSEALSDLCFCVVQLWTQFLAQSAGKSQPSDTVPRVEVRLSLNLLARSNLTKLTKICEVLSRVYVSAGKSQPGKTLFLTDKGQESTLQVSHFHFHKAGLEFELYLKFLLEVNELCCMELYKNDICSVIVFFSNFSQINPHTVFSLVIDTQNILQVSR